MSKRTKKLITKTLTASIVIMPLWTSAFEETKSNIEILTVTSQKRVQNVLKVPVTVGTITESLIEESGAVSLSELDKFITGFEFGDDSITQDGITMRGISNPSISVGGDPSSASFFDDVYMPQAAHNIMFSDIARVEVLKGPQGTLFGRNAAMGVVNIIPNSPQKDFDSFLKVTLGTDNLQRYEGMINLSVANNLYMRANYINVAQDGIVKNIARPTWNQNNKIWNLGETQQQSARISLLWDISSSTNFQISYDWDDLNQAPSMAVGVSEYAYGNGMDPFASNAENDMNSGVETRDMHGVIAKLNHELTHELSMKFILSYREWETFNRTDEDGTADITRYFDTINNEDSNITYTELQFNYTNNKINAVAGLSYSKEDVSQITWLTSSADSTARVITGELNKLIKAGVAEQLASEIGGNTDEEASAAFGSGVTFNGAVDAFYQASNFPLDHIWNADEWANALNGLGFADTIMNGIGMSGTPLTGDIVRATGDTTYNIVADQMNFQEIFGSSYSGQFWRESITNKGDFVNWGVYADIDYAITDKFNIIGGIRYSKDKKDFSWYIPLTEFSQVRAGVNNLIFSQADIKTSDSWDHVTGRLVSSYQITDEQMFFASYSTGYKSGGFDSLTPSLIAFEPEETTNIEIGYKAVLWDDVIANISAYSLKLTNLQTLINSKLPESLQAIPAMINEDRDIIGVEFDIRWNVNEDVTVGIISEIRNTDRYTPDFYNAESTLIAAQKTTTDASLNYTATLDWIIDLGLGNTHLHADYVFVENVNDQEVGLEEYKKPVKSYFIDRQDLNARFSWTSENDDLEIGLWGKNLFNKRYTISIDGYAASLLGVPYARINRGLEAGIDIKYSF